MKLKRIFALSLVLLMLLAAACNKTEPQPDPQNGGTETPADGGQTDPVTPPEPQPPEPQPPQESAPISWRTRTESEEIKTEDGAELLNIRVSVPQGAGETVDRYYEDKLAELLAYARSWEPDAREQYERIMESGDGEWVWTPYSLEADFSVQRNDGEVFSVLRNMTEYTGGTHPHNSLAAETFRAADGALITLDYLFDVPREEYLERIYRLVREQMSEREREEGMELYYEDARENMMERFDERNFFLTGDTLTVFWQVYDLAPHVAGVQVFDLPLAELADVISLQ